ncbi:MAG: serine hydrolase [Paludibacter sp.]|nr:serine hydrolase [Paludibacter sp.]
MKNLRLLLLFTGLFFNFYFIPAIQNFSSAEQLPKKQNSLINIPSIDSIVNNSIDKHIFPGCQVYILQNGVPIYDKSFGYFTYNKKQKVAPNTLYDLASLTKTTATLLAVMKLYDEGKIQLDDQISKYLPFLKNSDKANITITELLFHESGLPGSMLFYRKTIEKTSGATDSDKDEPRTSLKAYRYKPNAASKRYSEKYNLQVSGSLFLPGEFHKTAMQMIADVKLRPKTYLYSCVNFILLKEIVESVSGESLDVFVQKNFYEPMQLCHIGFLPLRKFEKKDIAPTLAKDFLRNDTIQGFVHDPDAAFLGGISGNAGLFASAHDVAWVYQMLLNGGELNGVRYLTKKTCELFTTTTSGSGRRGLGFDKPVPSNPRINPCCELAPVESYGHTGYTGTGCWVDPINKIVYVFLSNRTYPDDGVNKLARMSIRPKIQEEIYRTSKTLAHNR